MESSNNRNVKNECIKEPLLIIENCEPDLSEWLGLEYNHVMKIWSNTIFTNIPESWNNNVNIKFKNSNANHVYEIYSEYKFIVLDPKSDVTLSVNDFSSADGIIIGGILGYEKFTGNTSKYITKHINKKIVRSLGKIQLYIDSAALVTKMVLLGIEMNDIELTDSFEIRWNDNESTILPYGYVVIDNKVIFTPGLMEYIRKKRDT